MGPGRYVEIVGGIAVMVLILYDLSYLLLVGALLFFPLSGGWRWVGSRRRGQEQREHILATFAPAVALMTLAFWGLSLVLGFDLLLDGLRDQIRPRPARFWTSLYLSGATLLPLSSAQMVPTGGGFTATPVVRSSSPWFDEEDVRLTTTGTLSALTVTIVVRHTTGISFSGQYNSVGGKIQPNHSSASSAVTYTFTLARGQTLPPGTNDTFAAQTSGTGTAHPTAGDMFTVTATSGGTTTTQSGHFPSATRSGRGPHGGPCAWRTSLCHDGRRAGARR